MTCTSTEIVTHARKYVGVKEGSTTHKKMVETYNKTTPLPRNYKMKVTDSWCAMFLSLLAIECDAVDIIPVECSCGQMIALAIEKGIWVESDKHIPNVGDFILYDWNDNGKGDCTGWPDHIGIVERVGQGTMTIIEGNYKNGVNRRTMFYDARYIRGYITPHYNKEETAQAPFLNVEVQLPTLKRGDDNDYVLSMQSLLWGRGYYIGVYGADGIFGEDTDGAVRLFQKENGLDVDGIVGKDTWTCLLSGE